MKVGSSSRAPRREGKSLQMARLVGKRVLDDKFPVADNFIVMKFVQNVILSLIYLRYTTT